MVEKERVMDRLDFDFSKWECFIFTSHGHTLKSYKQHLENGKTEYEIDIFFYFDDSASIEDSDLSNINIKFDNKVIASLLTKGGFIKTSQNKTWKIMKTETDMMKSTFTIGKTFGQTASLGKIKQVVFTANIDELARVCQKSKTII